MSNIPPFYVPPSAGLSEPESEGPAEGVGPADGGQRPRPASTPTPAPGLREVTVEGPAEGVEGTPPVSAQAPAPVVIPDSPTAPINYYPSSIPNTPMAQGQSAVPTERRDAWEFITTELGSWGLSGLADTVKGLIIGGAGDQETMRVIRASEPYKVRFAGMDARRKAGFNPIDEGAYMQMEDQYRNIFRAYGLPQGLYDDPSDFANYIANDLSADEMNTRVVDAYVWVQQADPVEKAQLQQLYGASDGDFAAWALDPDRALTFLQQRRAATEIAAQGAKTGWGQLTTDEAERLQAQGVTEDQAGQGFGQLAAVKPLFQQAINETGGDFTTEQQLGVAFGNDTQQQQRLSRRQRARAASTQAGGGATTTTQGTGLGTAT